MTKTELKNQLRHEISQADNNEIRSDLQQKYLDLIFSKNDQAILLENLKDEFNKHNLNLKILTDANRLYDLLNCFGLKRMKSYLIKAV